MRRINTLILILLSLGLSAQQTLDTVLVSASRLENTLQGANRNVQIVNSEEIAHAPVNSVAELLDFVTGLDAQQRGIFGTQTDLSIRGGTFEQVLVLVNGVRISDPQTGHHLMNLPVQKDDIERIEVLLGGGSYIFGGSAFSGAVNIITKSSAKNGTSVEVAGGSFQSLKAGVTEKLNGENHRTRLSVNHTRSAGFKRNTDFDNTNLFAQSEIDLKAHSLRLSGGYTFQNFGAQNFYSVNFPDQYEKTRTLFVNASLSSGDEIRVNRQVYWRRNWDEFQLFREGSDYYQYNDGLFINGQDTAARFYQGHNYHRSDVLGGNIDVQFSSTLGKTSIGADYRYEGVVSNNLGQPLEAPIEIPGSRGSYTQGANRHNIALAGEHIKNWGKFNISLALQVNYNSRFDLGFYPATTLGYKLSKKHKLYGSFNRSFRLPSYTDLYYNLGGAVGSANLQPENSLNYELGYKYSHEKVFANLSLFRRQGQNIIDWIQDCDTCVIRATNTSTVNFNGLDFNFSIEDFHFMQSLRLSGINFGYSHLFTDNNQASYSSVYVYNFLQHKATLRLNQQLGRLELSYMFSFQDRIGTFTSAETGRKIKYPDVFLINARAAYGFEFAEVFVSAQNILDQRYFDRANVELPGLWLWTGVKFEF